MNIDLNPYNDAVLVRKYDLFINKLGEYFKIKRTLSKDRMNHNIWAEKYLEEINDKEEYIGLSPAEVLIHKYGFLYYSHDGLLYKPIIKVANPGYFKIRKTEEQLDSLFNIMVINGENPFIVPMLNGEENIYDYEEMNNERGKVYAKTLYKRFE